MGSLAKGVKGALATLAYLATLTTAIDLFVAGGKLEEKSGHLFFDKSPDYLALRKSKVRKTSPKSLLSP